MRQHDRSLQKKVAKCSRKLLTAHVFSQKQLHKLFKTIPHLISNSFGTRTQMLLLLDDDPLTFRSWPVSCNFGGYNRKENMDTSQQTFVLYGTNCKRARRTWKRGLVYLKLLGGLRQTYRCALAEKKSNEGQEAEDYKDPRKYLFYPMGLFRCPNFLEDVPMLDVQLTAVNFSYNCSVHLISNNFYLRSSPIGAEYL